MEAVALDVRTGVVAWRAPLPAAITHVRTLAVGDGLVLVAGDTTDTLGLNPWQVVALRAADGARRWVAAADTMVGGHAVEYAVTQALLMAGGNVIIEPAAGPLTALRQRSPRPSAT
jgi:hypothetical protein